MSALTIFNRGLFGREVVLDDAGIHRGRKAIPWDGIDYYIYDWDDWSRPGDFVVVGRAGTTIRIAPFFERFRETADRFIEEAHERLCKAPQFAPFGLADGVLACGDRRLPIAELAYVELASIGSSVAVVVHARGGAAWAEYDVRQIANFWLWLEAIVALDMPIRSRVPLHAPPTLSRIEDWAAAGEQLPPARARFRRAPSTD